MTYELFIDALKALVESSLSSDETVTIHTLLKNNGTKITALAVREDGQDVCPFIHLDYFYEKYCKGTPLEQLAEEILGIHRRNLHLEGFQKQKLSDFSYCRTCLSFRLIHYRRNKELLETIPHRKFLDLAICYYLVLDIQKDGRGSMLITKDHCRVWGVTEMELYQHARDNAPKILPQKVQPLSEMLEALAESNGDGLELPPDLFDQQGENTMPLFSATNSNYYLGAAVILYPGFLEEFSNRIQGDFYVIPSSIHEVLLLSSEQEVLPEELNVMVKEVNRSEISSDEVLSDHVYRYDRKQKSLHSA